MKHLALGILACLTPIEMATPSQAKDLFGCHLEWVGNTLFKSGKPCKLPDINGNTFVVPTQTPLVQVTPVGKARKL